MASPSRYFVIPPPQAVKGLSASEQTNRLKEFVKDWRGPIWHPIGTAAMLPREQGGVVDSNLKIYKTTNLRVVSYPPFLEHGDAHVSVHKVDLSILPIVCTIPALPVYPQLNIISRKYQLIPRQWLVPLEKRYAVPTYHSICHRDALPSRLQIFSRLWSEEYVH